MSNVEIVSPDGKEHLLPIAQLGADVFGDGTGAEQWASHYFGNCHYDWSTARIILDGRRIVHQWGVWGFPMRVESARLQVAGIGAVATHPDYRLQGLMHQAAEASVRAMEENGYDLSLLRGRHYVKLGYARAWNYVTYRINSQDLPKGEPGRYRTLGAEEIGEMDAVYNRTHAAYSGTAVRPTYRNRDVDDIGVYGWFDNAGRLEGYIRALPFHENPKELQCLEAAGDPLKGLAVLGDVLRQGEYERLSFFTLPHPHPLLLELRRGDCTVEDRYFRVSGWRVRIVNLKSALRKLVPLLESRLAGSQYAAWQGTLLLDSGRQRATVRIEAGHVEIAGEEATENAVRGGADVARFLIGSDEPDEIMRQAGMECRGLGAPLARVLFPNLRPVMSEWDAM